MPVVVVVAPGMVQAQVPEDLQAEETDQETQTVFLERLIRVAAVVVAVWLEEPFTAVGLAGMVL
jgi:hypothetical protein